MEKRTIIVPEKHPEIIERAYQGREEEECNRLRHYPSTFFIIDPEVMQKRFGFQ
ncbi:MAG: hypothetical protein AB7E27_04105 [Candidatus Methanomethylophilaceae archaeon]|jgi:hypothetical protein